MGTRENASIWAVLCGVLIVEGRPGSVPVPGRLPPRVNQQAARWIRPAAESGSACGCRCGDEAELFEHRQPVKDQVEGDVLALAGHPAWWLAGPPAALPSPARARHLNQRRLANTGPALEQQRPAAALHQHLDRRQLTLALTQLSHQARVPLSANSVHRILACKAHRTPTNTSPPLQALRSLEGIPNGGSARGYQRHLRDVRGQQNRCRLNMQPPGLNIYASQSCTENARFCRMAVIGTIGQRRAATVVAWNVSLVVRPGRRACAGAGCARARSRRAVRRARSHAVHRRASRGG